MSGRLLQHIAVAGLFCLLLTTVLSACSIAGQSAGASSGASSDKNTRATPLTQTNGQTDSSANSGSLPQNCPAQVLTNAYWNNFLHTQQGINTVESVTCAHLEADRSAQVLVLVRNDGTGHILNVYVYDGIANSTGPQPQQPHQVFKLEGLYKATAKISTFNTLITGEVDLESNANKGKPNAAVMRDAYREFKWSASTRTLVQTVFPGIFPDLTRFEAEADQEQVNQGHQPWKRDAGLTAAALVNAVEVNEGMPASGLARATIVSGGGKSDLNAVADVNSGHPGSGTIKVTMARLEGNINNIWIVTNVQTAGMSIDQPQPFAHLTSPVTITGHGPAFEGLIGPLVIQDRLDASVGVIGRDSAHALPGHGMGDSTFSSKVSYTFSGSQSGISTEEGTIALYSTSQADGSIAGMSIVKVLLS